MNIVGIICEYNPFHNGHLYHINESKKISSSDYLVAVMSGSFVQRGTPAILSKYERTKMALLSGADIVIELPVRYSTASAEGFAFAACGLLINSGIVNSLCFGSESGNIEELLNYASVLEHESTKTDALIRDLIKQGYTYPAAREKAVNLLDNRTPLKDTDISLPNNILGIEYIRALKDSGIKPYTIKRIESDYHDTDFPDTSNICSATAIRSKLKNNYNTDASDINGFIPKGYDTFLKNTMSKNDFSMSLYSSIINKIDKLENYLDVSSQLAGRIRNNISGFYDWHSFSFALKTRGYTYTRIERALCHLLLNIPSSAGKASGYVTPYIRVLGFKKEASCLMKQLSESSLVPVITKAAQVHKIDNKLAKQMLLEDIYAEELYEKTYNFKFKKKISKNEYTKGMIIL